MHDIIHPLAGRKVVLNESARDALQGMVVPGAILRVEDWWDRLTGGSWMYADGNPACLQYAMRLAQLSPVLNFLDDEVVYGHIGSIGHLVHVSELGEVYGRSE